MACHRTCAVPLLVGSVMLALALQSIQDTYTKTSLTQIEREFGLIRSTADSLLYAKWIGLIPGLIIFGYAGGRGDRLKYCAVGALLAAIGNGIMPIPHLIRSVTPPRFNMTAYNEIFAIDQKHLDVNATPHDVFQIPVVADNVGKHMPNWFLTMFITKFIEENPHLEALVPDEPIDDDDDLFVGIFGERKKRSNYHHTYPLAGRGGLPPAMLVPVDSKQKHDKFEKLKQAFIDAIFKKGANATYAFRLLQKAIEEPSREPLQTNIIKASSSPFSFCNRVVNVLRESVQQFKCSQQYSDFIAYGFFCCGLAISSFGEAAFACLGIALADDHLSRKAFVALLTAILVGDQILGGYVSGLLNTLFNHIWYNVSEESPPHMNLMDPRWIGAYWIGYLMLFVLFLLLIMLILIVRQMKGIHSIYANQQSALQYRKHTKSQAKCFISGFISYAFAVLTQCSFLLISLVLLCQSTASYGTQNMHIDVMNGLGMTKNHKESMIYIVKGAAWIVGLLIGTALVYATRGTARTCLLLASVSFGVTALLSSGRMALTCDSLIQTVWQNGGYNTTQECNIDCHCLSSSPPIMVCDEKGNPFYSPCHAGCLEMERVSRITLNFSKCACAKSEIVSPSFCKDSCDIVNIMRYIIESLIMMIDAIPYVPILLILIRIVREKLRSIALAIASIFVAIGALIGAPIYNQIADATCIHFESSCNGQDKCKFYDPRQLRFSLYTLDGGIRILSALFCTVLWCLVTADKSVLNNKRLNSLDSLTDSDEMVESSVWLNRRHIDVDKDKVNLYVSKKIETTSVQNGHTSPLSPD